MDYRKKFKLILKSSVLLLLIALSSCGGEGGKNNHFNSVGVRTLTVDPATFPVVYEYIGFTQSSHLVEIRARVEGYLDKIAYTEGQFVNQGDLLFQLNKGSFEAGLDNARGVLAREEAILWNAQKNEERLKPLFEQNAVSRRDLDNAIAEKLAANASVQSAKAKVKEAELNLGYTTIRSPISGLAADSLYREGALISPGPNSLLTTISVINPIWVNFSVSEGELLKNREEVVQGRVIYPKDMNFDVEVVLSDGVVFPLKGKVSFASPSINEKMGTMSMRAVLPNPEEILRPGQFVRVRIIGANRPDTVLVPQHAVLNGKNGMFVYVVNQGKAEIRNVNVGDWQGNDWIIKSGLEKGDQVIVDGVNKVQAGVPVQVLNPSASSNEKSS